MLLGGILEAFKKQLYQHCLLQPACALAPGGWKYRMLHMWSKRVLQGQVLLAQWRRRCESAWLLHHRIHYFGDYMSEW